MGFFCCYKSEIVPEVDDSWHVKWLVRRTQPAGLCLPRSQILSELHAHFFLFYMYMSSEGQAQVLMLGRETLYQLSPDFTPW